MFKNIIITILSMLVIFLWLGNESEDMYADPDDVTIEYKCGVIREYRHVPPEVLEECRRRTNTTEEVDNKTSV